MLIFRIVTPTRQYSSKDLPAHLDLKTRAQEQTIDHDLNDVDQFKKVRLHLTMLIGIAPA